MTTALFNRRMRKTARPVVWEPWRAKSRQGHPIPGSYRKERRIEVFLRFS